VAVSAVKAAADRPITLAMALSPAERNWPEERVDEILGRAGPVGEDYQRLIERLPAIVYVAEIGERGRWRYVSPQVEEILGFTPEEWMKDTGLWAELLHPEDRERALFQETRASIGERNPPPVDYRMITRGGDIVWILDEAVLEEDESGVPVWHGVLYDITERKIAEGELQRAVAQQAIVARLGERALQDGDPEALMRSAVSLLAGIEGIDAACVWGIGRDGRRLHLRAGSESGVAETSRRISAGRDSHAGAALGSGLHVIVSDWSQEERFSMPPALRVLGVASSLAVVIDGKDQPAGVLDIHSRSPRRFTPQDVHFMQAAANVLADAIERHAADQALHYRVLHDSLTGLPNRLSFLEALTDALRRGAASASSVGVLFLDLDHFKLINDSIGHHGGDELLRAVAPRLASHLRPGDRMARFGGDEFGILIDRLADEEEAAAIADRLAGVFTSPFLIGGVEHFVTASIGVAVAGAADREPRSADLLIRDADAAMYRAKERGRARCELFDAEMRAGALRRLGIEHDLRHALERQELELHYQPIVSLRSGEIAGLEALVRWRHPQRGLLDPGEFVSVAEDSGMIESIGRWVGEEACRQVLEWHARRPAGRPVDVSVNLSARQVTHRGLAPLVSEILARSGLDPIHLRLEITESALVEESATATASLEALSEIGVGLILDDFGTGFSSLAHLNRFPFDALKVDRSFVEALGVEQERTAIVEAILGMARALSLDAIAEGVENEAQLSELCRLDCDFAQGYLLSPPLAAEEVPPLLEEGARRYSGILPGR
jgi:diguanylate cyclase (GGDEF)-like protein/PAS domain S-box-containing protein